MRPHRRKKISMRVHVAVWIALSIGAIPTPATAQEEAPREGASEIVPPRALDAPSLPYPPEGDGRTVEVDLHLTLNRDGLVIAADVVHKVPENADPAFDRAALEAARGLRFEPARRDGVPVAARIHYLARFTPDVVHRVEPLPAHGDIDADTEPHTHDDPDTFSARGRVRAAMRSPSEFSQPIGALRHVPRSNATEILRLAPGILLTNEGGDGHAERVYLRGFDAGEGQDLEFSLEGIPFNEPGNPHSEGYADAHFIIPELVSSIRVLEGPFDPSQGNYAVAGSADYALGVSEPGVTLSYQGGSFDTHRFLALFRPRGAAAGTFMGADFRTSAGFGANRASLLGRAMGQAEFRLSESVALRVLAYGYGTQFGSAGVVRDDDFRAGRIGFFDTYDRTQGGDATRFGVITTLEETAGDTRWRLQVFGSLRDLRLRANYTGFLEDPPAPWRTGTAQRGDGLDQHYAAITVGTKGRYRLQTMWEDRVQSLEIGYYARHDALDTSQRRMRFGTEIPYRIDFDQQQSVSNLALYADAEFRPFSWLVARGGVRGDLFHYDAVDRCALHDTTLGAGRPPILDTLCYSVDRTGPRDPSARVTAAGLAFQPRASIWAGPLEGVSIGASFGLGSRAADPSYLAQNDLAPFSQVIATEAGVVLDRAIDDFSVHARAVYYYTRTGRDLVFNAPEGRNTLAPGTERQGALLAARLTSGWLDWNASVTYANAQFLRETNDPGALYFPADTGTTVPFVPTWVVRSDAAIFGELGFLPRLDAHPFQGRLAVGVSYNTPRPLLFGERGNHVLVVDASAGITWREFELGVQIQNLFDNRYRLSELNYASEFRQDTDTPNLIPVRHFTAGAPLTVQATLSVHWDPQAPPERPQ